MPARAAPGGRPGIPKRVNTHDFPDKDGGANGYRLWQWKTQLVRLADETGLAITVCHMPPGTSRWDKIEHRAVPPHHENWAR
jgi:hypothetical protein